MPNPLSENAQLIFSLIAENDGKASEKDILGLFSKEAHSSVKMTIGQLVRHGKLRREGEFVLLGDSSEVRSSSFEAPEPAGASPSTLLTMPHACEEPITVPNVASARSLIVEFIVTLTLEKVRRIGISPETRQNTIVWLPPGANLLRVQLGEYHPSRMTELMTGKYLAVVVATPNGGHTVRYYSPPKGEVFALTWVNSD